MIVLYILLAILGLLSLFLALPWTLRLTISEQGDLRMKMRLAGFSVWQSPEKQRKVRLRDYTPRAMRRRAKKKQPQAKSRPATPLSPPGKEASLTDKLSFTTDLASTLLSRSLSHARVKVERLAITVASPDAARTAMLYGAIAPALALLLEALKQFSHLKISLDAPVGVAADFTSERIRADVHILFRLHMIHLLDVLLQGAKRSISSSDPTSHRS